MANKVLKAIEDSKRKRDFKQRNKGRKERSQKRQKLEKNKYVQRGSGKRPAPEEDKFEKVMAEDDPELERELEEAGILEGKDGSEDLDEAEFLEHGDELDLPDLDDDEEDLKGEETDSDLEDYYRELGIENETDELQQKPTQTKPKKKAAAASAPKEETRKRVLDEMIEKVKATPTYANLTRTIKVVKQVFFAGQASDEADEGKKKKDKVIAAVLTSNAGEYKRLMEFFAQDVPKLILRVCSIAEKSPKQGQTYDLKKMFGHLSTKQQMLLKTYAANFNKLLGQTLDEGSTGLVQDFLISGSAVAMCCLPFGLYRKKLAANLGRICMLYAQMEETAQMLSFQGLQTLLLFYTQSTQDKKETGVLFELVVKKMYMEFTKESKSGGGGFQVQDKIRVAQNCFVAILGLDLPQAYQLGFLYIRQLCLHVRNIRNSLTKEGIKNVYSWQFFNCVKLWALAVTEHLSELILLVNPLVQLGVAALRLSSNAKYFPFHIKIFQMLSLINKKTGQFVPIAQYLLYVFDGSSDFLVAGKVQELKDKAVPDTLVSLKFAKKHADTLEVRDRIVKEVIEELTIYYAANSRNIGFPEATVPLGVVLRKFKKLTHNGNYRKIVASFLDLLKRNEDLVVQKRSQMREKAIKNLVSMLQSFESQFGPEEKTPLEREAEKIEVRRTEYYKNKIQAQK